jgi:hypothetical protein
VDTASDSSNETREEATVSLATAQQVRAVLADLLARAPVPAALEGLPIELWLERIVPVAVAAELLCLTPETVLKKHRAKLLPLDGRKFGMRLRDALKLEPSTRRPRKPSNQFRAEPETVAVPGRPATEA